MDDDAPEAMPGSCAGASSKPFQRFEVYTGAGRRRSFTTEEKLALVARMAGCENISELARRHQLRPSQLFTWRRELRYAAEAAIPRALAAPEPMFVPAVIDQAPEPASAPSPVKASNVRRRGKAAAAVELEIDGVAVKIARGADATLIGAVIDALKTRA
jgi:transposase